MRRYLLPLLAIAGVVIIIVAVILDNSSKPVPPPSVQSPASPFPAYVTGAGIVEANGGNIAVGTPVSGIVTAIYVKWGDQVKADDKLFKIDDRDLQGQLLPALANIKETEAKLKQAKTQLQLAESVPDKRAISVEEISNRRAAVAIAETSYAVAKAQAAQIRMEIERRTVHALAPGKILQINTRLGELAQSGGASAPMMLLGDVNRLQLRVNIDEYDAWRIRPGASAVAFIRGRSDLKIPLKFERIEPYVTPKTSLAGASTERVDTRVLQIVYSFDSNAFPIYAGQQMDVYVQAAADETGSATSRNTQDIGALGRAR